MSGSITMNVGKDGSIVWSEPRSPHPFVLTLFGMTNEQLFLGAGSVDEESPLAQCKTIENIAVSVEAGIYNVVGGQILSGMNYLNVIEVASDGQVTEKRGLIHDEALCSGSEMIIS